MVGSENGLFVHQEDVEMLEELFPPLDLASVHRGESTPIFFGSAFNNFGVEPFLESFLDMAISPGFHHTLEGKVEPEDPHFSGFVFKVINTFENQVYF